MEIKKDWEQDKLLEGEKVGDGVRKIDMRMIMDEEVQTEVVS